MVPTGPSRRPAARDVLTADQDSVGASAAAVGVSVLLPVVDHADAFGQRSEALVGAETAALRAPGMTEIPVRDPGIGVLAQFLVEDAKDEIDFAKLQVRADKGHLRCDFRVDGAHARD